MNYDRLHSAAQHLYADWARLNAHHDLGKPYSQLSPYLQQLHRAVYMKCHTLSTMASRERK